MLDLVAVSLILLLLAIPVFIFLRNKSPKVPPLTVSLAELATIWQSYNKTVQPAPVDKDSSIDDLFETELAQTQEQANLSSPSPASQATSQVASVEIKPVESSACYPPPQEAPIEPSESSEPSQQTMSQPTSLSLGVVVGPLKSLWTDYIKPYESMLAQDKLIQPLQELLKLIENHGHCPSIVTDKTDSETVSLFSVKDNLAQVSLKDHTYQVTFNMLQLIKDTYKDYELLVPKALFTALAHDIGKIPELRQSGLYNTANHPLISATKLKEFLIEANPVWTNEVVEAVKNHHTKTDDSWTVLLRNADQQARELELLKFSKDFEIKRFTSWFDIDLFYSLLEPYVNTIQLRTWVAFTFNGIIYCKPDFVYSIGQEMCKKLKVLDLTFIIETQKEDALRMIVQALKNKQLVPPLLGINHYCRRFEIKSKVGLQKPTKTMLIPIYPHTLNIDTLESRKQGFPEIISQVTPT